MRHRSSRPLLDLLRGRPTVPAFLRRLVARSRARAGLVVASGVALASVVGITLVMSQFGEGVPRSDVAPQMTDRASSPAVGRADDRAPLSPTSDPSKAPSTAEHSSVGSTPSKQADRRTPSSTTPDAGGSDGPTLSAKVKTPESPALQGNTDNTPSSSDSTSSSTSVRVDDNPPETTASTASVSGLAWVVDLGANEPATFECSLDGAGYAPCAASLTYNLDPGKHTLQARAIDTAGNVDPSPASLTWHPAGKVPGLD